MTTTFTPVSPADLNQAVAPWERIADEITADLSAASDCRDVDKLQALIATANLRAAALVKALKDSSMQVAFLRGDLAAIKHADEGAVERILMMTEQYRATVQRWRDDLYGRELREAYDAAHRGFAQFQAVANERDALQKQVNDLTARLTAAGSESGRG